MTTVNDLLIELGTEELPPLALKKLSDAFTAGIAKGLEELGFQNLKSRSFATPRRLAAIFEAVPSQQEEQQISRRGPAIQAAFDKDGKPSKAAEGFAKSCGVSVEQLGREKTDKGEWLFYESTHAGKKTISCLQEIVDQSLASLPIPKRMRWGSGDAEFVRPVHWLVILFGKQLIDAEILGIKSGRNSYGHRFHAPKAIELKSAGSYEKQLAEKAKVITDFSLRKLKISELVLKKADELGGVVDLDSNEGLLDEVTALVEWPVVLNCSFDESFLRVPAEALVSTMKENQKYFPVYDKQGQLTKNFIIVSNIESQDPSQIREGNERVVRPRLADAEFFWDQDRKKTLAEFNEKLHQVIFQRKLGTIFEKVERTSKLAAYIAELIGADVGQAEQAGLLCKADLMTEMVFEFPKLQGIMGRYYALNSGENEEVAHAIEQHYWPRYAGDNLPESSCGQCVALADKLDTLVGIFAVGDKPTGVRDPFALRRAALGVLKILIEKQLDLDIEQLLTKAATLFPAQLQADNVVNEVFDFIMGRLKADYEAMNDGYTPQHVAAVMACRPTKPLDFDKRIDAVKKFSSLVEAESLSAANKRTANILKKSGLNSKLTLNKDLLQESAEKALYEAINSLSPEIGPLCDKGNYSEALQKLAGLRDVVDQFFEHVMVMADDEKIKNNRLALLQQLHAEFGQIADIALLQN